MCWCLPCLFNTLLEQQLLQGPAIIPVSQLGDSANQWSNQQLSILDFERRVTKRKYVCCVFQVRWNTKNDVYFEDIIPSRDDLCHSIVR